MNESPTGSLAHIDELVERYSSNEPRFAFQYPGDRSLEGTEKYYFDEATGNWSLTNPTAVREASVVLTGSLMYDRRLESYASVGKVFQFRHVFSGIRNVLNAADLTVGSLGTTVADMYPTVTTMNHALSGRGHYSNARKEYLDGIKFGGFDALALSHGYSLDAGARGALATSRNVLDSAIVPFGTGTNKSVIFDVNGIKIGLYSCALKTNLSESLTDEGRAILLSDYDENVTNDEIAQLRERGAQFIIAYLDTQSTDRRFKFVDREAHAKRIAEAGADYVVCTEPRTMSRCSKFTTSDNRQVTIASSLGTIVAGIGLPFTRLSAMLRVKIWQTAEGTIEFEDSYIPIKRHPHDGRGLLPVSVIHPFHGTSSKESADSEEVVTRLTNILGSGIKLDRTRRVSNVSPILMHHTPRDLAQILGTEFSTDAIKSLGSSIDEPIAVVATPDLLAPAVCAIAMSYRRGTSSRNFFTGISKKDLTATPPVMAIAESNIKGVPTLVVENAWFAYMKIVASVRDSFNPFTVAVTGTAGKTTTKDMMGLVFSSYKPTLHITGNGNTEIRGAATILRLAESDSYYIQEIHGATPGSAKAHSRMVKPDLAVITSIGEGHLEQMGSIENIVRGKMEITEGLDKDGVLILNNDNEYLKKERPAVNTIRYAINDPEADYRAINIKTVGEKTEFEIVEPDGSTHFVRLSILGNHNVSNALATFAAARQALIPPHRIVAGLSRFKSSATRQNIIETGGYKVFLDAFNSNVLSMTQAISTLETLSSEGPSGRRIVVMGDMGEQGDKLVENHELIGAKISQSNVDLFFGIGEGVRYTASVIEKSQKPVFHTLDHEKLIRELSKVLIPGDVVLFKGAGSVDLARKIVYPLFGKIA